MLSASPLLSFCYSLLVLELSMSVSPYLLDAGTRSLALSKEKSMQASLGRMGRDKDVLNELQFNLKLFYAQRNMYLTGFTLFLAM